MILRFSNVNEQVGIGSILEILKFFKIFKYAVRRSFDLYGDFKIRRTCVR